MNESKSLAQRVEDAYDELAKEVSRFHVAETVVNNARRRLEVEHATYLREETNDRRYRLVLQEILAEDEELQTKYELLHAAERSLKMVRTEVDKLKVLTKMYVADRNVEATRRNAGGS